MREVLALTKPSKLYAEEHLDSRFKLLDEHVHALLISSLQISTLTRHTLSANQLSNQLMLRSTIANLQYISPQVANMPGAHILGKRH